jgi:hypothetical protein
MVGNLAMLAATAFRFSAGVAHTEGPQTPLMLKARTKPLKAERIG